MQKGDWIGVVIVGAILAGIGLFFAFAPKAPEVAYAPVEVTGSSVAVTTPSATDSSEGVAGGGTEVRLSAEIKRPGFVTIHQAIGEAPGPVVGQSALLSPGNHADLIIKTTEPMLSQGGYFALLFVDDGDGVSESGVDLPVMSNGQVIKVKLSL